MLLLIIAIAVFQMLSQGPERRGWGAAAGNAGVFLPSPLIHVIYLKRERRETVSYDTSLALLLAPAPALSVALSPLRIGLDCRNASPKLWLPFREAQPASFPPLPPVLRCSGFLLR